MGIQMQKLKKSLSDRQMPQCKYCNKNFVKDTTLAAHLCVKKQRANDRHSVGSRLGFMAFRKFYELTTKLKTPKTYEDFIDSSFYNDFVKYGRYLCDLNPIDTELYTVFLIKNSKKMPDWTKPESYKTFLIDFLFRESVDSALERTINTITEWSTKNNTSIDKFFSDAAINEIVYLISIGKISPWCLYYSKNCNRVFENLTTEHAKMIIELIDPDKWKNKFSCNKNDVDFVKELISVAEL